MTTRVPKLAGALNFRDMGGYRTTDGRTIRWNQLYRSGTTHAMTPADLAELRSLGVRYSYDLRSNSERHECPSQLAGVKDIDYRCHHHDKVPGNVSRILRDPNVRAEQSRELMVSLYRQLPYEFKDAFHALFEYLVDGRLPLVFNCAAGKDRTGVAAALVLGALGVPRRPYSRIIC